MPLPWIERLRDGSAVRIRPLRYVDAALVEDFLQRCSPQTLRYRFLGQVRPGHELAEHLTDLDSSRDVVYVAVVPESDTHHVVGIGRFSTNRAGTEAECAITVRDDWQGRGLGVALTRHLIEVARARGVHALTSIDATENTDMRDLAAFLGFRREIDPNDGSQMKYTLML